MNQGPCQNNSGAKVNVQITYINQQAQSTSRERECVCGRDRCQSEVGVLERWLEGV